MQAEVHVDPSRESVAFDRMIFGQFVEHFHRQVYGGLFEPGSPLADERGFRRDVMEAVRALGAPIVRWPGGCFASAYHWRDGVGPDREPTFDKAWQVEDPNTAEILDLFTHEQYFWPFYTHHLPDHVKRLDTAIRFCTERGYKPVFFHEGLLGAPV